MATGRGVGERSARDLGEDLRERGQEAGLQRFGEQGALFAYQAATDADLAVLADRVGVERYLNDPAVGAHAGQGLGAQVGSLRPEVTTGTHSCPR